MILTDAQVIEYIRSPYAAQEIAKLQEQSKELCAHVTGKNAKSYLTDLPQFERDDLREERLKMMMSSVPILSGALRPRNRIYSAKGGEEHYIITDETKEKQFRSLLNSITHGMSLKGWIQMFAMRRNDYDPNGIILIEKETLTAKSGVTGLNYRIYPCFKSILNIIDRQLNGRIPEYLILKLSPQEIDKLKKKGSLPKVVSNTSNVYRCIDDTSDRLFYNGKLVPSSKVDSFSQGRFPGIVSSNIPSDQDDIYFSPLHDTIELLRQNILWQSLYNVVMARQAFPKEYMQRFDCINCLGTGVVNGIQCPECHGTKIMLSQKHADTLIIDWGDEANKHIPTPPMGAKEASVETLEFFDDSLDKLADKIYYILWGMYKSDKMSSIRGGVKRDAIGSNIEPTAYQAMLNAQPMVTQLVEYSKWYIGLYEFIANFIGGIVLGNSFKGSVILAGDRFMIESPDATWDRYLKAVQAKAPVSELDSILTEYIENKYATNPSQYSKYMLLLGVEPFLHCPIADVLTYDIPQIQKDEKIYYASWKNSLSEWDFLKISQNIELKAKPNPANTESDIEPDLDLEDDANAPDAESNIDNDPIKNLKAALRAYTIKMRGDDAGLPKQMATMDGTLIPSNATLMPQKESYTKPAKP